MMRFLDDKYLWVHHVNIWIVVSHTSYCLCHWTACTHRLSFQASVIWRYHACSKRCLHCIVDMRRYKYASHASRRHTNSKIRLFCGKNHVDKDNLPVRILSSLDSLGVHALWLCDTRVPLLVTTCWSTYSRVVCHMYIMPQRMCIHDSRDTRFFFGMCVSGMYVAQMCMYAECVHVCLSGIHVSKTAS